MAYTLFRDICLHSFVSMLLLMPVRDAGAQRSKSGVQYHIAGAAVTVAAPRACAGDGVFLLSAHAATIEAALLSQGMRRAGASASADADMRYEFVRVVPEQRYGALRVQRLAQEVDGRALWCVQPVGRDVHEGAVNNCRVAADEPWTLLTHGLAHVSQVRWHETRPDKGPASTGTTLRVDLRHAATELEPKWTATTLVPGAAGASSCGALTTAASATPTAEEVADSVVWHSQVTKKRLALTFDACSTYSYGPFNPQVVAALEANDVPATLFVGGHWAEMHPDTLKALARNPLFEIGNHSYSHPHMRDLMSWQQAQELRWTQSLIYNLTGVTPRMFRPPYGEVDDGMLQEVARAGLTTVEYDLPAGDADVHVSPVKLTRWVVNQAQAGSIVIMHMNRPKNHTAQALPMIVKELRAKGFTFCQMGDLLHDGGAGCR